MITSLQIYEYLKEKFEENITTLKTNLEINHSFQVKWFDKLAIEKELDHIQDYYNEVDEDKTIIGIIDESELIQDPAVPQSMYQLNTSMSFMIEEAYIDDFYSILKNFIVNNKVSKYVFGNETVMINVESGWNDDRQIIKGKKMYLADFLINMIILSSVVFSNDITVEIDGIEVVNAAISLANEIEMVPNLRKQIVMGMIPNTSVFQISLVSFLDLTNPPLNMLLRHITNAQLFNQPLNVIVYIFKGTEDEILLTSSYTNQLFVKSVELEAQRGTVAILKTTLVTAALI